MQKIKRFNESESSEKQEIWIAIVFNDEHVDFSFISCFTTEMLAWDYIIKFINREHNQDFEPFLSDNGDRFFADIDENEDFKKCIDFCEENKIVVSVKNRDLRDNPIKSKNKSYL